MAIFSILLAILALGFLIFIHELGHYFMAKRVGMRVETFSIGMGSPIFSWMSDGTKWQLGWIPFGGFVKIAGTDTDKNQDLEKIKDGYFSKTPWERIKVSIMGPLVNILFALLAFALLWVSGGREKPFSEYTKKIGVIDTQSELYAHGVRAGDEILELNGTPYGGAHDLIYLGVTNKGPVVVKGAKFNYGTGEKSPFTLEVTPYPSKKRKDFQTIGISAPANFLVFEGPLSENSPLKGSDIQNGDQIVWLDGKRIFSLTELSSVLNDGRALITINRNGKILQLRAPRIKVHDLKMTNEFRDELTDWQFAAGLNTSKFPTLFTLPYNLTNDGVVENRMSFIDLGEEDAAFPAIPASAMEQPLLAGDKIIAVDGVPVKHSSEILKLLQERHVQLIVARPSESLDRISWQAADSAFDRSVNQKDLDAISETIGTAKVLQKSGNAVLLKKISPKPHKEIYAASPEMQQMLEAKRKEIAAIDDPLKKAEAVQELDKAETKLELGLPLRDLKVEYNPIPTTQFMNVVKDISKTLRSLFTGSLNPKYMSGPVGIVSVFQEQSRSGVGESLYWLGLISLNLGLLNLLPIPMLDGGTIVINLIEMVTGRKLKPETLEKIILPFAIILILFFIFLTYHDISRLFGG